MLNGTRERQRCAVTFEALEKLKTGLLRGIAGQIRCFNTNRRRIKRVASEKFDKRYFEADGTTVLVKVARHKIPAMYELHEFTEAGGLMSYGPSSISGWRQVGVYTGRILKGEKPANLPVQLPTKYELAINLKSAKALGLEIPPKLLALADEVRSSLCMRRDSPIKSRLLCKEQKNTIQMSTASQGAISGPNT
jgi:hypothetical protein